MQDIIATFQLSKQRLIIKNIAIIADVINWRVNSIINTVVLM